MLVYVPLKQIDDNPYQERLSYEDVPELAGRIAAARESYPDTFGLMQVPRGRMTYSGTPSTAEKTEATLKATGGGWPGADLLRVQLAFGHRRLRAMRHLHGAGDPGYESGLMPVHIDALTDEQMLDAVWSENYDRADITPIERARLLYKKLQQPAENGSERTQADVGREWGMGRSTVANSLRLLELPSEVQVAVHDGAVSSRLALDLLPVVEILEALDKINGKIDWGKNPTATWGAPVHPEKFIQFALDGEATSDQVREYAKQLINWIGQELPPRLMEFDCGQADGIQQPTCSGCPLLARKNVCLHRGADNKPGRGDSCAAVKMEIVGQAYARQMAAKTGYEYSDDPEAFRRVSVNGHADDLLKAHQSGRKDGIVIGFRGGWGVRPWGRGAEKVWRDQGDLLKQNMEAGLILGLRPGTVLKEEAEGETAVAEEANPIPDHETRSAWHQAYNDLAQTQWDVLIERAAAWLNENCPTSVQSFLNTLVMRDGETAVSEETVRNLLMRSPFTHHNPGKIIETSAYFAALIDDVPTLSPMFLARLWANYGLYRWWAERGYRFWDQDKTAAAEALARAHALRDDLSDELRDLVDEALADVAETRQRLGKEDPTKISEPEFCSTCCECDQVYDDEDVEFCATCQIEMCAECYIEDGHVAHDSERDPELDDIAQQVEHGLDTKPGNLVACAECDDFANVVCQACGDIVCEKCHLKFHDDHDPAHENALVQQEAA